MSIDRAKAILSIGFMSGLDREFVDVVRRTTFATSVQISLVALVSK